MVQFYLIELHFQEWNKRLTDAVQVQSDMERLSVDSMKCDCSESQEVHDEL